MSRATRDMKIVLDAIAQIGGKHSAVAIQSVLSDAAKQGRETSVSEISKQVALSKSYIARHLRVMPPARKGGTLARRFVSMAASGARRRIVGNRVSAQ